MPPEEDLTRVQESSAAVAAEEAAFAKSFNENREIAVHVDEPTAIEPVVQTDDQGTNKVEAAAVDADSVRVAESAEVAPAPKLFAGLTEEQLQAALARSGTLQTTVDKMAGRIGQLMQQIEGLRNSPPTTQAAQVALDLKLEKLSSAFPELASLLREDLQGLQGGQPATLAPTPPSGVTQEQLDALLNARLSANDAALREQIEMKVLGITHPDWLNVIKTPQFAIWRDSVLGSQLGQELMASEDSTFITQRLNEFKQWRKDSEAPQAEPAAEQKRSSRLANAVLPAGTAQVSTGGPVTEEDAFFNGFKQEQQRANRAA